ncbi:N-acetylmuramoyl-L-alanine amidase [Olivibacter sp. SDN3]|uniref:N-acetylmuramoyl-L-alanine amidase family protein n=1 Tax=Olivibacter sp. SDN3 TaxID=2764720 RepID=UPI00165160FC|nr:N-acetylmuramoyl-L-alanine amidase [Olivibacter sp. SDN3]QNL47798.1 N-acetylmuramoyl-L-alanine amidase [Olivibacter sp. SDN3]
MQKISLSILIILLSMNALLASSMSNKPNKRQSQDYRIKTIVIDAGHGAHDAGARGRISLEKDVALQLALKLGKAVQQELKDVQVFYTRTSDVFVPLYERIGVANEKKADLFISIHCNSMPNIKKRTVSGYRRKGGKRIPIYKTVSVPNTTTRGTETFVSGFGRLAEQDAAIRENASLLLEENYKENYEGFDPNDPESYIIFSLMKNAYRDQSIKFASLIEGEYVKSGRGSRGVKELSLAVLARAGMPAVLTEVGFISNPDEERYLNSTDGQTEVVNNLLNAIKSYKKQVEN